MICLYSPNVGTLGILVGFKDYSQEDTIFNKEDALTCLRFRSSPLRGVECLQVKEGECVLAMHKAHCRSLFFDAIILKVFFFSMNSTFFFMNGYLFNTIFAHFLFESCFFSVFSL